MDFLLARDVIYLVGGYEPTIWKRVRALGRLYKYKLTMFVKTYSSLVFIPCGKASARDRTKSKIVKRILQDCWTDCGLVDLKK